MADKRTYSRDYPATPWRLGGDAGADHFEALQAWRVNAKASGNYSNRPAPPEPPAHYKPQSKLTWREGFRNGMRIAEQEARKPCA